MRNASKHGVCCHGVLCVARGSPTCLYIHVEAGQGHAYIYIILQDQLAYSRKVSATSNATGKSITQICAGQKDICCVDDFKSFCIGISYLQRFDI